MADPAPTPAPKKGIVKLALGGGLGIATGAIGMYFNAAVNTIIKPAKPLANFVASADGLTLTCENHASGQSGYWDFGDGSALEPFDPDAQTIKHAYAKPGNYSVKLTVRNFLMDENDRNVSVDLAAATATATNAPQVLNLKVEAIRDQVPATYRITGKLQNADEIVWRLGDKTEHIAAPADQIDRYVTFDTDGEKQIVLTALSHTHQDPQVIVQAVAVKKPHDDAYDAMVTVTDTVMKVDLTPRTIKIPVPVQDANGPTKSFARTVAAGPNCTIQQAQVAQPKLNVVKNLKVDVAKDQKSATVSGEWTMAGDALAKAAGGSDVIVPLTLQEQHSAMSHPAKQVVSGVMGADQKITLALPPRLKGTSTRTVAIEFGISRKDGKRSRVVDGTLDASGQWRSAPMKMGGQMVAVKATMVNDTVQIAFVAER